MRICCGEYIRIQQPMGTICSSNFKNVMLSTIVPGSSSYEIATKCLITKKIIEPNLEQEVFVAIKCEISSK